MPERGLKETAKVFIALACYPATVCLRGEKRRVVLNYHSIDEGQARGFRRQMEHLARHYACIAPSAVLDGLAPGKPMVAITFDDAFKTICRTALPLLKELRIPAAICVPSGNMGACPGWDMADDCKDFRLAVMDGDDLRKAVDDGFELFSHTVSHPRLDACGKNALDAELADSKACLEERFNVCIKAICYPYGAFDQRILGAAREAGYSMGFTVEPEVIDENSDPLSLGRVQALPDDGSLVFALKCSGAYSVFGAMKRWLRRGGEGRRSGRSRPPGSGVTRSSPRCPTS